MMSVLIGVVMGFVAFTVDGRGVGFRV